MTFVAVVSGEFTERMLTVCMWLNRTHLRQWIFWVTFWTARRGHSARNLRRKRPVSAFCRKKWGGIVNALSKDRKSWFCISEALWLHHFWLNAVVPRRLSVVLFPCLSKFLARLPSTSSSGGVSGCPLQNRWASGLAMVHLSSIQGSSVLLSPCSVLPESLLNAASRPETCCFQCSSSGPAKCVPCVDTACLLL